MMAWLELGGVLVAIFVLGRWYALKERPLADKRRRFLARFRGAGAPDDD